GPRLWLFLAFMFLAAAWLGGGIYHSILTSAAWYRSPLQYVLHPPEQAMPGLVNPFPLMVGPLAAVTLLALAAFAGYRGDGRREVWIALYGARGVIRAPAVYFAPALTTLFDRRGALSAVQIVSMSRRWVVLTLLRLAALASCFVAALLGLTKFRR